MAPDQAISNWKKLVFATVAVAGVFLIFELTLSLVRRTRIATAVDYALRSIGIARPATNGQPAGPADKVKAIPVDAVGPEAYTRDNRLKVRSWGNSARVCSG